MTEAVWALLLLAQTGLREHQLTGDRAPLKAAQQSLRESFRLAPDNFPGRKLEAAAVLLDGEAARALDLAKTLNRRMPDDLEPYGIIVRAALQLGRIDEAEKAADWMLRLRPVNRDSLAHAAMVRERLGDTEGASDFWNHVYRGSTDALERSLALSHLSRLAPRMGRPDRAEPLAREALRLTPKAPHARRALEAAGGN